MRQPEYSAAVLTVAYFQREAEPGVREGLLLGTTWMIENWLLDFVGVVPFTHTAIARYFMEIGLRYVPMMTIAIAIGYAWRQRRVHA